MANIKVVSATDKTAKTGKPYKSLEVQDESGAVFKVNVFSNAPDFANIKQGSIIVGTLAQEGQYWNISFEGANSSPRGSQGFKTAQVKEVMDIKRQDIGKFQDNKELSIKMASTMRMAVDLAIAEKDDRNVLDTLEQGIRKWRQFCWENWDVSDKDFQPFN